MNRSRRTFACLLLVSVVFVLAVSVRYLRTITSSKRGDDRRGTDLESQLSQWMAHYDDDSALASTEDSDTNFEMRLRLANIRRVCRRLKAGRQLKPFSVRRGASDHEHIIVDDKNKLLYCYVPKVASTNWKRILLILKEAPSASSLAVASGSGNAVLVNPLDIPANDSHRPEHFRRLNDYTEAEVRHRLDTYLKFVFVRHPFERLLSAYRNKFQNTYSDYFRERFGRTIVQRHRPNATARSLATGDDVTFAEFVEYLLDPRTLADGPLNEHWRTVNELCRPCHVDYDVVGKYETLEDDARQVLERAGVARLVQFPKINRTVDTVRLLDDYFTNVSRSSVFRLYQMYALDFKMFGYDHPDIESYNPD